MSYVVDGENVYYEDEHSKKHIGLVNKTETIRIDANTVADVVYQFDLQAGGYVEESRVTRSDVYTPPFSTEEQITTIQAKLATTEQSAAENALSTQQLTELLIDLGVI